MWQGRGMKRLILSLSLALPSTALSDTPCASIASGDASLGDASATCRTSVLQGGAVQNTCYWSYGYRDAAALDHVKQIDQQIQACLGADTLLPPDDLVNHPDSFDLHQYEADGQRVAVSLKDKAGLSQSLVFFSLSRDPD